MKKLLIVCMALLFPVFGQAAEINEEKMQAATEFIELQNMEQVLRQMFEASTQMMPEGELKTIQEKFYERLNYQRIEQGCILAAARNFTLEELVAMIDFYSTPLGKSIVSKQGAYSAESGVVVQQEFMSTMSQIMQELGSQPKESGM